MVHNLPKKFNISDFEVSHSALTNIEPDIYIGEDDICTDIMLFYIFLFTSTSVSQHEIYIFLVSLTKWVDPRVHLISDHDYIGLKLISYTEKCANNHF